MFNISSPKIYQISTNKKTGQSKAFFKGQETDFSFAITHSQKSIILKNNPKYLTSKTETETHISFTY